MKGACVQNRQHITWLFPVIWPLSHNPKQLLFGPLQCRPRTLQKGTQTLKGPLDLWLVFIWLACVLLLCCFVVFETIWLFSCGRLCSTHYWPAKQQDSTHGKACKVAKLLGQGPNEEKPSVKPTLFGTQQRKPSNPTPQICEANMRGRVLPVAAYRAEGAKRRECAK